MAEVIREKATSESRRRRMGRISNFGFFGNSLIMRKLLLFCVLRSQASNTVQQVKSIAGLK